MEINSLRQFMTTTPQTIFTELEKSKHEIFVYDKTTLHLLKKIVSERIEEKEIYE